MSENNQQQVLWEHKVNLKRKHSRFSPLFNTYEIYGCIISIDRQGTLWSFEDCEQRLRRREMLMGLPDLMMWRILPQVLAIIGFVAATSALPFILIYLVDALTNNNAELLPAIMAFGQITLLFCAVAWLGSEGGWKARFFLNIARVMKAGREMEPDEYMAVQCMNLAGRAARNLFCAIQQRRRTWVSPPTVADMALEQAYPLIDIHLSDVADTRSLQLQLHLYISFLYYSAALVAVRRYDLIPPLRRYYEDEHALMRRRSSDSVDQIPERDALFLDPMRNQTRWTVAKDYYYPLATWFSFLVSMAAFIVSLIR